MDSEQDPRNGLPAWDPASNSSRVVNDPMELEEGFRKGQLQVIADHEYPFVGAEGQTFAVKGSDVDRALKDGFHFATAVDVARAEAGTVTGMARTVADGALDGLLVGMGGAAQASMGVDELGLQARREENPGLHALGMAVPVAAEALLSGGASVGALGAAGAARVIGTEAAATTLGRMGAMAAGGALEGAAFGVGNEVTEAVLGNAPLAADSLIAAGMHGGAWGGAAGALLGRALGRSKPTADEIGHAMTLQLGEEAPKGYGQRILDWMDAQGANRLEEMGAAPEMVAAARGDAATRKRFVEFAQTPQGELDAKARGLREALEARIANDEGLQRAFALEREVDEASVAAQSADAELRRLKLEDADRMNPAAERARAEAAARVATAKEARNAADNVAVEELRSAFGITSDGKVSEEKLAAFVSGITRPRNDSRMKALYRLASGDEKLLGVIDDLAERQASKNMLRDQLVREQAGGADMEMFAGIGGYGIGGFQGALVAREAAQQFARPARAMMMRYRLAAMVQRVRKHVDEGMASFARGAERVQAAGRSIDLDRRIAPYTATMLTAKDPAERRKAAGARIAELSSMDPTTMVNTLAEATVDTDEHAPNVSGVVRQRLAAAHEMLRSVLPQPLAPQGAGGGLVPVPALRMIPDRDIRRFAQVDAAIQDPLRIVDALREGRAPDPAAVKAVQVVYPALWAQVVQSMSEQMAKAPDSVGWRQAVSLAVTMGVDSHPSFRVENLNLQQAIAKQGNQPRQQGPVGRSLKRARDQQLAGSAATLNDSLMERSKPR